MEGLRWPLKLTGGCLCESIRFEVIFDNKKMWPPESATCQCTMCRKWTAGLVAHFIVVSPSQITPELSAFSTYHEYESSPRRYRGFCGNCGSGLIWRSLDKTDTLDLFLGTIDERWLVGEKIVGSEKVTKYGIESERRGGLGREICSPNQYRFYEENAIPGITDLMKGGERFLTENSDGCRLD